MPPQAQPSDAANSIVWIELFGGPHDGEVFASARSLVGRAPVWIRRRTKHAVHVYKARKAWQGERTITLYHRGAYRVHFPGK